MVQGGGENQQGRGNASNGRAASPDSLVSSHGEFVSVVGLEGGIVREVHVESVRAVKLLPLGQSLDSFAFWSGISVKLGTIYY